MNDEKHIYVFGAGNIGRRFIDLCIEYGISLSGVIDNNEAIWQTEIRHIFVQSPSILDDLNKDLVKIAVCCKQIDDVLKQIKKYGIDKNNIHVCNTSTLMMKFVMEAQFERKQTVFFDLQAGLALGGVESWSIQTAHMLKKLGYDFRILLPNGKKDMIFCEDDCLERIHVSEFCKTRNDEVLHKIGKYLPCVLVNNFASTNFAVACLAKRCFAGLIQNVCVIHNDEEAYYESYVQMEKYIDYCLVISNQIYQKILNRGFPEKKLIYLLWEIPCQETFAHVYAKEGEKLRLGYAGRVTITQKRVDLLLEVARKLVEKKIDFQMDITGLGDYLNLLQDTIFQYGLERFVHLCGLLERNDIPKFWSKQDIMISCSDWEGHSITQCEAMAEGAVPIITDVSGARDDVEDGINGFIVNVGDINQIVEKVCYLSRNREKLPQMGQRAYETIKDKYSKEKVITIWKSILQKQIY